MPVHDTVRDSILNRIDEVTLWLAEINLRETRTVMDMYDEQALLHELGRLSNMLDAHAASKKIMPPPPPTRAPKSTGDRGNGEKEPTLFGVIGLCLLTVTCLTIIVTAYGQLMMGYGNA